MSKSLVALVSFATMLGPGAHARAQVAGTGQNSSVPETYAGNWVCQTAVAGYNIRPPHAEQSQPQTNTMRTPPTVAVRKFSLAADGTYETAQGKGRYAYDAETQNLSWLDGPHKAFTRTQLGRRDNGAPRIGFVVDRRYYGCFLSTRRP